MKKQLLIISSVFASAAVFAQPVFNHSDGAPQAGDVYTQLMSGVHPSPGSAGANQTWNLSTMTQTATVSNSVTTMAGSPHAASFPNANLQSYDGTNYAFLNTANSKFFNAGFVGGGITAPYSDQEEWMQFPSSYNSQFTDNMAVTFTSNSITFNRTGTTTVTYDGYGTLTTPAGTYSNVARFQMVQNLNDASQFATITSTITTYTWRMLGDRYPLAQTSTAVTPFSNTTISFYRNVASNPVGINENSESGISILCYPNPATERLTLKATQSPIKNVEILDLQGRVVYSEQVQDGNSTVDVNVSALAEGIYAVCAKTAAGQTEFKKITVKH